jgi:hypothetical protein
LPGTIILSVLATVDKRLTIIITVWFPVISSIAVCTVASEILSRLLVAPSNIRVSHVPPKKESDCNVGLDGARVTPLAPGHHRATLPVPAKVDSVRNIV